MDGSRIQFNGNDIKRFWGRTSLGPPDYQHNNNRIAVGYTSTSVSYGYNPGIHTCRLSFVTPEQGYMEHSTAVFGSMIRASNISWYSIVSHVKAYLTTDPSTEYSDPSHAVWTGSSLYDLKPYYASSMYGTVGTFCFDFDGIQLTPNTTYYLWISYSGEGSLVDSLAYIQAESIYWQSAMGILPAYVELSPGSAQIFDSGAYRSVSEYIMTGGSYNLAIPYIFSNGEWKL